MRWPLYHVTDISKHIIQVFSADGAFLTKWDSSHAEEVLPRAQQICP